MFHFKSDRFFFFQRSQNPSSQCATCRPSASFAANTLPTVRFPRQLVPVSPPKTRKSNPSSNPRHSEASWLIKYVLLCCDAQLLLYCNNHNDPKGSKISRIYLIPPDCALMSNWFWVGGRLFWVGVFTGAFPIAVFHFSLSCASASSKPLSRMSASTSLFQVFFGLPGINNYI